MHLAVERWPLRHPFRITGHVMETIEAVVCTLSRGGASGRGEATGVYYRDETGEGMAAAIEAARAEVEAGATLDDVQNLLPPGGARNALDCALWELESLESGVPVWRMAELEPPRPLPTTFTLGADAPEAMARRAAETVQARALKLKLIGDGADAERVAAVRRARPDVWLGVDANQAFDRAGVEALLPALDAAGVKLLEQPCPMGEEETLRGLNAPMPLAADESAQTSADLDRLAGIFDVVNIKLDKTGGLTEALAMARGARAMGLKTMVGNMIGTSLSCAPGFLAGQMCEIVDLDGPWHLASDRDARAVYADGAVDCPAGLWGAA
jgi:L-alanine-DL-glutamate epimerase-like enolase superfamily enzyme